MTLYEIDKLLESISDAFNDNRGKAFARSVKFMIEEPWSESCRERLLDIISSLAELLLLEREEREKDRDKFLKERNDE